MFSLEAHPRDHRAPDAPLRPPSIGRTPRWRVLKQLIAEGDFVVAVAETRGRIVRDFYGVPGQGKPFTNRGTVVYRFQDGKIAAVKPYFDDLKIVTEQLGATLLPPQPDR